MPPDRLVSPLAGREVGGSGNDFVIVEWTDPGDGDWEWIAPLHVHHQDDEAWYVLEGTLRFRIEDTVVEALHAPGARSYPDIFRAHDSEMLA